MDDMFLQCNKNAIYVLNTSYRYGELDMINLFGSPAGRAITELSSTKSCAQDVNSHTHPPSHHPPANHHQQSLTTANSHHPGDPHHQPPQNQPASSHTNHQHHQSLHQQHHPSHHQHEQQQRPSSPPNHHPHQLIRGGSSGDLDNFLLLQQQRHDPHHAYNNYTTATATTTSTASPPTDKSKKSLIFKSNVMLAKKAKFWKFLEDDDKGSKKNSLEDLSSASSGKSSLSRWRRQNQKSSSELYREAAQMLGLSCTLSDSCRCLDCQSRYFECEDSDTFSENSFNGDTDLDERFPATDIRRANDSSALHYANETHHEPDDFNNSNDALSEDGDCWMTSAGTMQPSSDPTQYPHQHQQQHQHHHQSTSNGNSIHHNIVNEHPNNDHNEPNTSTRRSSTAVMSTPVHHCAEATPPLNEGESFVSVNVIAGTTGSPVTTPPRSRHHHLSNCEPLSDLSAQQHDFGYCVERDIQLEAGPFPML